MKKLTLLLIAFTIFLSCKKEDPKVIDNPTTTSTTTYKGFFRESGSYLTTVNGNHQLVSYDSTTVNLFVLTKNSSSYALNRVTPVGDTILIQDNFELNQKGEFGDTTGGGSSYYHMYIKFESDSLFIDRVKNSGMPNVDSWEVKAKKV